MPSVPRSVQPREVRRAVLELDRRLEPLDRAILTADWDLYTGRSSRGASRWQLARAKLLSAPGLLDWVRHARRQEPPRLIARRLKLLERAILDTLVEQDPEVVRLRDELQQAIVAFRPLWDGRRVNREVLYRTLRTDPDARRRRRALYAFEPLYRPLERRFVRLVRLRNEKARAQGFRSFPEMRLGFQGFSSERILELASSAATAVPEHARRLRDRRIGGGSGEGWHRWDLRYALERTAALPERSFPASSMLLRILRAVREWGFRTDRMRFRVVFHDLPAGGLTLAPDPPDDIRILVHPRGGWDAYMVMFHEVGHAVQSASIRSPGHLLRWHENIPGFGGYHEGIGGLFEEIPRDRAWIADQPGIGREQAERFAEARDDAALLNVGWLNPWIRTELSLYRNPERDPSEEAQRWERRLFGFDDSPPTSFLESFYVADPVYAPNYLLAALFHHQLARSICDELGEPLWPNPKVGPWLTRNWFAPGSLVEWVPHLREVTGRPFSARAFRERFR